MGNQDSEKQSELYYSDPVVFSRFEMSEYNGICRPDLLFFNSKVITVDPDFTIADAVAIKGEKIMFVGDNESILELSSNRTKLIDLKGKVLMPGIVDSHLHILWTTAALDWIDCRTIPITSIKEIVETVRENAKESKPGEWILGRGWDETKLTDRRSPSKQNLDEATPNNCPRMEESVEQRLPPQ